MEQRERVKKILVELYEEFQQALIDAESRGNGKYNDEDFESLKQFIAFISNN